MIGDSIAFGLGVSDETFTHLLNRRPNNIEAANLAVPGYGPGKEPLVLYREGLRCRSDVVVLAFVRDLGLRLRTVALDGIGHFNSGGHSIAADVLETEISQPGKADPP